MKRLGTISLRMRITLLAGALILFTAVLLTTVSTYNAGNSIHQLSGEIQAIQIRPIDQMAGSTTPEAFFISSAAVSKPATALDSEERDILPAAEAIPMLAVQIQQRFDYTSYVVMALVVAAGMAFSWFLAGRALAPVQKLSQTALKISANNLNSRIPQAESKDEIGELTESFNGMLNRLEESFERQKRFSSNVAHELKTPLATLKMSLQTGRMEYGDQECGELFAVAERSVDRLTRLVDDLTRLTNEGQVEMNQVIGLEPLLRGVVSELELYYSHKQLNIQYRFPAEAWEVLGNRELVRRLFYNLVENGMKYNHKGGSLKIEVSEREGDWQVRIADSGPGIEKDQLTKIFEPFYCVDASRSRKLGGAGLGLSIVREAAQRHGWQVDAESAVGEGTAFTVTMPKPCVSEAE